VHHSLGDGSYGNRRAACERAAKELGVKALRDVPADGLDDRLAGLDDELRRRARHVVTEDARVLDSVAALRARDWARLGHLMVASHASLRDDYEVSCAELDAAVDAAMAAGAVGARMTGGGFGGSAVVLAPAGRVAAVQAAVADSFASRGWSEPSVFEVTPSDGARRDA
jgi:galactokinase